MYKIEKQNTKRLSLVFTGESGVGKSTLAEMFASRRGLPLFSVGGFERDYAKSLGYDDIVTFEKEFGLDRAYRALIPPMLDHIQNSANEKGIVIEGVYDPFLYGQISNRLNLKPVLVNVAAPLELRISRKMQQYNMTAEAARNYIHNLDSNKEAVGLSRLLEITNIRVLNDGVIEKAYSSLENELRGLLRP